MYLCKKTIMKKCLLVILMFFIANVSSQNKKLWAKSFLNTKSPKIEVQGWISEKPDTLNKFVLIDFWATWCGPCKKAIPEMNTFSKLFKDRLVVIGISDENRRTIKKMKTPVIEYFSAYDTKKRLYKKYQIKGIPHVVLIDPNGVVRWEGFPFLKGEELTREVIANAIKEFDKESK